MTIFVNKRFVPAEDITLHIIAKKHFFNIIFPRNSEVIFPVNYVSMWLLDMNQRLDSVIICKQRVIYLPHSFKSLLYASHTQYIYATYICYIYMLHIYATYMTT